MLLYLEVRSGLLSAFASPHEAELKLEAIDITNREFEFCDDTGQRFAGVVSEATSTFRGGRFRLEPAGAPSKAHIAELVSRARSIDKTEQLPDTLEMAKERYCPNQSKDPAA
jgi:hypothetical protein